MKYITYEKRDGSQGYILFGDNRDHEDIKNIMNIKNILGAGFITLYLTGFYCYGESVTLKIKSRGDKDSQIITRLKIL